MLTPPHGTANVNVAFRNVPPGTRPDSSVHGSLFKNVKTTRYAQLTPAHHAPDPNIIGSA